MLNVGDRVRSPLRMEGVVIEATRDNDGQLLYAIRWRTGVTGYYTQEEVRRYRIRKVS